MTKVAVLDDWQGIAEESADWSPLKARAEISFFADAFSGEDEAAAALADFEIVLTMRERTPFPASLIARLPKLRLIGMTGSRNASLDLAACKARGITVSNTETRGNSGSATAELALGLLIACARGIPVGDATIRAGGFQHGVPVGETLAGKTLGIIGLGRLGRMMAGYGQALGMKVLAWSQNLTPIAASQAGFDYATKDDLLAESDAVSLHLVLSDRTRGILGSDDLARMKPRAILINTSRAGLVDQSALQAALREGRIRAGLDVFTDEPLGKTDPWRTMPNTVLTPHIGYGVAETWADFYPQSVENALAFLDGKPIRTISA
ncbi:D-2-hydroxyacid dehydrogenase family protein [Acidisoma cellulosilytica]|uniref:D-2-hydroxyacid dehydrogenase family protein n=1 Tax=Acidisoma cellulosilyticum TaxID=2802395 RepID=A0A964E3Q6_9PROT|nr:D-2-hydroxyacid dehydrogenase family protein [Acidisoma cellulosilyticum]MCB8880679.1 D-2-hydroxyacid dehydrogenase family protein [Acidisoma cellulosilyticum]